MAVAWMAQPKRVLWISAVDQPDHDERQEGGDQLGHGNDQAPQLERLVPEPGAGEDAEIG